MFKLLLCLKQDAGLTTPRTGVKISSIMMPFAIRIPPRGLRLRMSHGGSRPR